MLNRTWSSVIAALMMSGMSATSLATPLPDPLTLNDALVLAQSAHPDLALANAELADARAHADEVAARSGLEVYIEGRLEAIEPSEFSLFQDNNNSQIGLVARKRLYDFGHTDSAEKATELAIDGKSWRHMNVKQQRHLTVMKAFLEVILSDLAFTRDNEKMAVRFVRVDRARKRNELGKESELSLLEKENLYELARHQRALTEGEQRATRSRLAIALNRPGELPSKVVKPVVPTMDDPLPEVESLTAEVLSGNPRLLAMRAEVSSAEQKLAEAESRYGPVVRGEFEAWEYNRQTGNTDPLMAAIVIDVPLFTGGYKDAGIAKAAAHLQERQALLAREELELRQAVLELWLNLQAIQSQMRQVRMEESWRDLYLDERRTLYDMEFASTLGDAMSESSSVHYKIAETEFAWMLALAKLEALRGTLLNERIE
ncbi:MAG: TolC family protein [bacterium]